MEKFEDTTESEGKLRVFKRSERQQRTVVASRLLNDAQLESGRISGEGICICSSEDLSTCETEGLAAMAGGGAPSYRTSYTPS